MIRFIAKILIERYYDDANSQANADPLPRWLRQRVQRDVVLQRFETQLTQLDRALRISADAFVQEVNASPQTVASSSAILEKNAGTSYRTTWSVLALAASLLVAAYVAHRISNQPVPNPTKQIAQPKNDLNDEDVQAKYRQWVKSSIAASKRLTSKMRTSRNKADKSLAFMHHSIAEEFQSLESASRSGIRFVGQKIPAATIKMLGMDR